MWQTRDGLHPNLIFELVDHVSCLVGADWFMWADELLMDNFLLLMIFSYMIVSDVGAGVCWRGHWVGPEVQRHRTSGISGIT